MPQFFLFSAENRTGTLLVVEGSRKETNIWSSWIVKHNRFLPFRDRLLLCGCFHLLLFEKFSLPVLPSRKIYTFIITHRAQFSNGPSKITFPQINHPTQVLIPKHNEHCWTKIENTLHEHENKPILSFRSSSNCSEGILENKSPFYILNPLRYIPFCNAIMQKSDTRETLFLLQGNNIFMWSSCTTIVSFSDQIYAYAAHQSHVSMGFIHHTHRVIVTSNRQLERLSIYLFTKSKKHGQPVTTNEGKTPRANARRVSFPNQCML